jgi:5-(carboxyamino)imidazole ribonucleotide synthase
VTVGILGGGQLGRMLALAGAPLGERFLALDPTADSPAGHVGDLVVGAYDDRESLAKLASQCGVVTYEFESVPVAAVRTLEELGATVFPPAAALEVAQDRFHEKSFFERLGIPTAAFARVDSKDDLARAVAELGFPAVLKTRRFGYDGKGQAVLRSESDIDAAWSAVGQVPSIVERFVPFDRELSILAVRGRDGSSATYALTENHHQGGILRVSYAPAPSVGAALHSKAATFAEQIVRELSYVGVIAVEFFAVGHELVANEMAPRVHNSGHWTIEGAETSQFENHLRAILGLPLGAPTCVGASAMINVIGRTPDRAALLEIEGAHLHLYGKEPAPGRKLGHVTVRGDSHAEIATRVARVREIVDVDSASDAARSSRGA